MQFGTIIGVVTLYWLFHPLAMITKSLQGKAVDIVKAFKDIEAVKGDNYAVRSGVVNEFSKIYDQAEHLGKLVGVEPIMPRIARRQSHR